MANFNPRNIASGIMNLLAADSTLNGVGYLGTANKIYLGRAPNNKHGNYLVITASDLRPGSLYYYTSEIRVFCYVPLLANGQISPDGDKILARCEELLNDETPVVSGFSVQPLISLGIVSSFFDQVLDKERSRGVLRIRADFGEN